MSHSAAFATAIYLLLTGATVAQMAAKTARIGMLCPVQCGAGPIRIMSCMGRDLECSRSSRRAASARRQISREERR
jgi:hypothetical protein